jgi:hypothetical protein
MNDFQVYYRSGNRLLHQESLYRILSDGHYIFKYSPSFAFFSIPFSILPLFMAKLAYWILLTLLFFEGSRFITKKFAPNTNRSLSEESYQFIFSLILSLHFMREVDLGQINLLLSIIFIFSGILYVENKKILAAFLLAFTLFLKPFALILLPFLAIKKDFKFFATLICASILFLLAPCLFFDTKYILAQNMNWIQEMKIELSNKKDLLMGGNHTIFSIVGRYTPLFYFLKQEMFQKIFKIVILFCIGISVLWVQSKLSKISKSDLWTWFVILSWIPLISYTSDNAFGAFCFPLILLTLCFLPYNTTIYLALFFISLNPLEISHHPISQFIFDASFMGLSAFYLIVRHYLSFRATK